MTNILVTGADGFIGSHLVEMLVKKKFNVTAIVQYNSLGSWGWLDQSIYKNDMEIILGDIRDPGFCREVTRKDDIVFNLAALISIPYSYTAPESYLQTNLQGTMNLLNAFKDNKGKKFIGISTSEVYGTAKYVPIDENHPLQPQSPYSASKISADMITLSYFNSYNLPVTIARPFNTYGPRQSARAVIPTIITQIAHGMKKINLGDTSPTRDFNYVEDTCRALIDIALCDKSIGEIINIGSNNEITIYDTLTLIKKLMNSDIEFIEDNRRLRPSRSEVYRLWCDNTKIKKLINYKPKFDIARGLKETIDWMIIPSNLKKYKHEIYNI